MMDSNHNICSNSSIVLLEKMPLSVLQTNYPDNVNNSINMGCCTNVEDNLPSIKMYVAKGGSSKMKVTLTASEKTKLLEPLVLLERFSLPVLNESLADYQNIQKYENSKHLADDIKLNKDLISKKHEHDETVPEPVAASVEPEVKTSKNSIKKNSSLRTEPFDHTVPCSEITNVRMTRSKKIKLQVEKRKHMDKMLMDKFNIVKVPTVQLDNFIEKIKFLGALGLTSRFKCPSSISRVNRK